MSQKQPIEATVEFLASQHESLPSASEETAASEPVANSEMPQFAPPTVTGEIGRLGKYRIQKELGRGGMGAVYLAFDERLQRQIAFKVMLPKFAANANAKDRFLREARAAAQISSDYVVNIHEADEIDGTPYIALQLLQGYPLDEYLKKKGTPSLPQIMRIGKEMAIGLAAAHKLGLVHRDVKPGNVWLEAPNGRVKILDFGLAKPVEGTESAELTAMGALVGTPAYMAPEQAQGQPLDGRADLFSVGCVLYRLCTGKPPFARPTLMSTLIAIATEEPKPVRELNPNVPQPLADLIHRLLSKNAADRSANAQAVVKEFDGIIEPMQKPGEVIPHVIYAPMAVSVQQSNPFADIDTLMDSETAEPLSNASLLPPRKFPAILVGSLLFALIAIVLAGFIVIKITNKDGTVTEVKVPKDSKIEVDGKPVTPDSKKTTPLPPEPLTAPFKNGIGMEFVKVPKGTGWLGGGDGKPGDREIKFQDDFYLGKYPVTQAEWLAVTGKNPSHFSRTGAGKDVVKDLSDAALSRLPVEMVSWHECQEFVKLVNEKVKETGWTYRLPTNDEWEYACRGGPQTDRTDTAFAYYFDKPTNQLLPTHANFNKRYAGRTKAVDEYPANRLGLHDMHGNVHQWCADARSQEVESLVRRGGSFWSPPGVCQAGAEAPIKSTSQLFNVGFRLARVPVQLQKETSSFTNSLGMKFMKVPKGTGWLGGGARKPGETKVVIEQDFYLGKYEVTQEEWEAVTGLNPSHFSRNGASKDAVKDIPDADLKRFPVENVSWDDCQLFIERLNKKEKDTGWVYRMPKEAEWEYACRGGPVDKHDGAFDFYFAKPTNTLLPEQANFRHDKGLERTCKVGSYEPNSLGLYDIHGNIWEWCDDTEKSADGALHRVIRSGSCFFLSGTCGAAYRSTNPASRRDLNLGLRLARVPVGPATAGATATDPDRKALEPIVAPPQFMEVHGFTLDAFKEWTAKLPKGYQPSWISLRASGEVRFDAVATLVPKSREWKLIFVNRDDDKPYYALKATHRLARCGNYKVGDKFDYFTLGIFDNQDGQESSYWYGNANFVGGKILEGFKLERELNGVKERWLPYSLIAYDSGDGIVYQLMSSWQPDAACEWHPELTADELATKIAEYRKKGWQPHIVSVHSNREDVKFLAVFTENKANEMWDFTPNLSVADYETQLVERKSKGQRPRCVGSHTTAGKVSYTVVWDRVPASK